MQRRARYRQRNCSESKLGFSKFIFHDSLDENLNEFQEPNLRNAGIQDNLFLDRYAESVTRNGREVPQNMTGIWAVKNEDIDKLLEMSSGEVSNLLTS